VELNDNDYHRRGAYAYLGTVNIYSGNFDEPADQPLTPGFQYTTDNKAKGAYVQAQMRPIEPLSVLVGLRYDDTDSVYNAMTTATISKKKEEGTSGRVGLTYDLTEQVSVYGLYARSFSPVLFDVDRNGDILDAEEGEIYEIGAKSDWFEGRLAVNAALYRIDRTNIPVAAEVGPGQPPYSISSGLQRSEGFEVEVAGSPLPGWQIGFAYNHLDSAFEDPRDAFYGLQPGGTADWQVSLFSTYELQSGLLQGFGFGATVFAIDDRGVSTFVPGTLAGYERVDLHLFYKGLPQYEFALQIRNVTDERYVEGADRTNAIAFFGSPTSALLTLRRNFGR
jgi:outer membrane receptor protein involved in Fe transport